MKKLAFACIAIGFLLGVTFYFVDREGLGAAQLLGIETGAVLILLGIGLLTLDSRDLIPRPDLRAVGQWLLSLPPSVWVVAALLTLYLALFISPLLFSKPAINYFVKYIPDAWVTRIGFDVEQTVSHIQTWLTDGASPYADGIVPYSPLTLLVFAPFVILGYPAYFKLLALISAACFILAALLIPLGMRGKKDVTLVLLFFVTGLVSYGFQFELERGQFNVIAFAACLLAIYLFHFHHKFHYFAYLLFSFAIQLKLYPAIFIFMFVRDWRDWKGNLKRFAGLGLANLALLFVAGYDLGMQYIVKMVNRQGGFQSSRVEDLSISGFVYHLTTDVFDLLSSQAVSWLAKNSGSISMVLLVIFLACLFVVLLDAYRQNRPGVNLSLLVVCVLGALFIPAGSFDYKLPILVAPLALFLTNLAWPDAVSKRIACIVLTIGLSLAYWSTLAPFTVKPPLFAGNFPALFVILLCVTSLHFLAVRGEN